MVQIQSLDPDTRAWADALVAEHFGSTSVISKGVLHDLSRLPGFVAWSGNEPVGVLHYRIEEDACEVVSLVAAIIGQGIGSDLLRTIRDVATKKGCSRVWLITTNDNVPAQEFYRAQGFSEVAVYPGAVTASRALKPEIPLLGLNDVPIEDEIEYEFVLHP